MCSERLTGSVRTRRRHSPTARSASEYIQRAPTMTHCTCRRCGESEACPPPPPSTRPGVYCLRCSGWRQALKKQELKNTLFWWGGCSCGFVIAITIRGPDRLTELEAEGVVEEEEGGRKRYVIPHATQREGTERERKRKRDVGAWQCVCLPLFFPYLLTNLSLPPIPPHPPPASRLS